MAGDLYVVRAATPPGAHRPGRGPLSLVPGRSSAGNHDAACLGVMSDPADTAVPAPPSGGWGRTHRPPTRRSSN